MKQLNRYIQWVTQTEAFTPLEATAFVGIGMGAAHENVLVVGGLAAFILGLLYRRKA